jgi:hypothetical protein
MITLLFAACSSLVSANVTLTNSQKIALGKHLYEKGTLLSGEDISAIAEADITLNGKQVACSNCHRRSGMGTNEGQIVIPPVTRDFLYQAKTLGHINQFQFKTKGAGTRPAYTDETLKKVIRTGIDPSGKTLDRMMPRFNLTENQSESLIAYIKTLTSNTSPGVSKSEIHFATVITDTVPSEKTKAMLDVLNQYFTDKNAETRNEGKRALHAPWHRDWKYQSYRKWRLHVWELKGNEDSWAKQLQQYYDKQPVFAMLSGLTETQWTPIHAFCERLKIPALFPNTRYPVVSNSAYYTLYFSEGLSLEAKVLARHLNEKKSKPLEIIQVYRQNLTATAAHIFNANFSTHKNTTIHKEIIKNNRVLDKQYWKNLFHNHPDSTYVLWLNGADLLSLSKFLTSLSKPPSIFLSSTLAPKFETVFPLQSRTTVFVVHPYVLPKQLPLALIRTTAWLRQQKILSKYFQIQANTYFSLRVAGRAISHLRDKFSREYMIEIVEHVAEKALETSVYPRLSLGPSQRFASKGAYILKLNKDGIKQVGDWIVP